MEQVETYSLLRQFADSWMLLFMFLFFIGVVAWVILGRRGKYQDTAESIFRNEDKPAEDPPQHADAPGGKETRE